MKLISMTDFVLSDKVKFTLEYSDAYKMIRSYAQFLKQPLTLGMFVPTDEYGNVLEEPIKEDYEVESDGFSFSYDAENYEYDLNQYQQSKERVLFDGFEVIHSDKVRITIQYEFSQLDYNILRLRFEGYNTIECLTGCHLDLSITQSALKQIGL